MRIRVTTSIDVCSTPLQPDGTPASRAPPKGQWGERKILKSSDSRMPSFAPHQDSAASCFVAIQRPRKNSRLSAFLHGFSVVGNQTRNTSAQAGKASHHGAHHHSRSPHRLRDRTPASRSRFSTRSIIDPGHSPVNATRPLGTGTPRTQRDPYRPITTYDAYQTRLLTEMGYIPQTDTNERRHRRRAKRTQPRKKPALFPQISDQKARQKVYGCLLSGALLAVILTIYLALATSNAARGVTFHTLFVFFLLVIAIIFSHCLIRLCMLAFLPKKQSSYSFRKHWPRQRPAHEEEGLQPRRPIPVILSGDEELGLVRGTANEVDLEKALPPPPPAYGLWRTSVRADPNLVHWGPTLQTDVQQRTRELVFAESRPRPPSYTSDDIHDMLGGAEPITAPLPLFAERRHAATCA